MIEKYIIVLIIQAAFTWALVGLIWFVQLVHYPLYSKIKSGFIEYERSHIRRTGCFVGPMMLIEGLSAFFLVSYATTDLITRLATINVVLLILIWLVTFFFQVYAHQKLSIRFSSKVLHGLVASNWLRTLLWSIKGLLMALILYYSLR